MLHYDLAVIGGGSGGVGAALAAARAGLSVLVVEAQARLGGTSTVGGVNAWETGVGGTGVAFDLYRAVAGRPREAAILSASRHFCWQEKFYWPHELDKVNFPGGEARIDPALSYKDTLRRHSSAEMLAAGPIPREFAQKTWHQAMFEPDALAGAMERLLAETGRCAVRTGTSFFSARAKGGRVETVTLSDGTVVSADAWVDGSGDVVLARACGCEVLRGREAKSRFNEPSAPEKASEAVNGATLMYRIMPAAEAAVEPLPADVPGACWWAPNHPPMCCNEYPGGGFSCNLLPAMEGREFMALGEAAAYAECARRVLSHWHFVQVHFPEFRNYRLSWRAPKLGIRESWRVVAEQMLTENEVRGGLSRQAAKDVVAIADHALDTHGAGGLCRELAEPYGIPYRCLIPRGFGNLLVACRGAGFSALAASSCRLSRTMLQLGQAAGTAVALAKERGVSLPEVPPDLLRERLRAAHASVDWPPDPGLPAYASAIGKASM